MNILFALVVCIVLAFSGCWSAAKEAPLFSSHTPLNAVLTAPLTHIYKQKSNKVRVYLPSTLSYTGDDGVTQRLELTVKTRGVFRRANCSLPPLLLNFKKKAVSNTVFARQDKLKLVSPCTGSVKSQQQLMQEYLIYRVLEIITDKSLKTRLVRMSYVDSNNKRKPWTHLTFMIEDEKDLAKRYNMQAIHLPKINSSQLDPEQTALVELFQMMIGNTDFSTLRAPPGKDCCHNMQILGTKNSQTDFIPVPYDFDSAGLINAHYAVPAENLPIDDVRQRLFRGRCKADDVWASAINKFQQHRSEIVALFTEFEGLNKSHRKRSLGYIEGFFKILDSPERIEKDIIKRCVGKS